MTKFDYRTIAKALFLSRPHILHPNPEWQMWYTILSKLIEEFQQQDDTFDAEEFHVMAVGRK